MDTEKGPLQKLLMSEEYSDLEDIVTVEGRFVELDKTGEALQQVEMGISPDHLFVSRRHVLSWKEDPLVVSEMDADLEIYGLELKWITPLRHIDISPVPDEKYILRISAKYAKCRYFELCTMLRRENLWRRWLSRISYLKDDPYGYISNMSLRCQSDLNLTSSTSSAYSDDLKHDEQELQVMSEMEECQTEKELLLRTELHHKKETCHKKQFNLTRKDEDTKAEPTHLLTKKGSKNIFKLMWRRYTGKSRRWSKTNNQKMTKR